MSILPFTRERIFTDHTIGRDAVGHYPNIGAKIPIYGKIRNGTFFIVIIRFNLSLICDGGLWWAARICCPLGS